MCKAFMIITEFRVRMNDGITSPFHRALYMVGTECLRYPVEVHAGIPRTFWRSTWLMAIALSCITARRECLTGAVGFLAGVILTHA
jgi:hypothetical protein